MDRELEKQLQKALHQQENLQKTNGEAADQLCGRILEIADKECMEKEKSMSFSAFFLRQLKYLSLQIWMIQGLVLVALIGSLGYIYGELSVKNERGVMVLLCACSVLILLSTIPAIGRSYHYQMYVVESATRFSVGKLLLAKLLATGIGDCILIGSIFVMTLRKTDLGPGKIAFYLVLAILLLESMVLYLIAHISMEKYAGICMAASGILLFAVFAMNQICPWLFEKLYSAGGGICCLLLIIFCLKEIRQIVGSVAWMELQASY